MSHHDQKTLIDPLSSKSKSATMSAVELDQTLETLSQRFQHIHKRLSQVLLGQEELITHLLTATLAGGHMLLEGPPGVGKTLAVKALSSILGLTLKRVQCTPDLMPNDILGGSQLKEGADGATQLIFMKGPIFSDLFFADEINRASPRTQSALLEAMAEHQITLEGTSYPLGSPFLVLATQNPIEVDGTYPLPEAQADRFFFKLITPHPPKETLAQILSFQPNEALSQLSPMLTREELNTWTACCRTVLLSDRLKKRLVRLIISTRPTEAPKSVSTLIEDGVSPRGAQDLYRALQARAALNGRLHAHEEDLEACVLPCLRHRLRLRWEARAEQIEVDEVLRVILKESEE